jgi:LPS-assembly lipoprotein
MPNRRLHHRRLAIYALSLLLTGVLSACGFRLRGAADTDLQFKTVYLGLPENSALGSDLRRYIRSTGNAEVVNDPKQADAIVEVVQPERRERVVLSLNAAGQPIEYTLWYRFSFRVRDNKDHELLPPTAIALKRDLTFNAAIALAKEAEAEALYRDMQSDLAQQVMRRLAAIKPVQ